MNHTVMIYDTTLRDGNQAEGVSLSLNDKLHIAARLDEIGVHFIEGGWPNPTNPKDVAFFKRVGELGLKHARVSAFGSTRRAGNSPQSDPILRTLLDAETEVIAIFGKSWDFHAERVLRVSLDENLEMIRSSVEYLASQGREVVYDAEHYFDGYLRNPDYALRTLKAAEEGGARWLVLCDTNGGTLPHEAERVMRETVGRISTPWGIHTHNDCGCAVATSMLAAHLGATQIQGTINGYGERCGNANLCTIIPNLVLKMHAESLTEEAVRRLSDLSRYVSELAITVHDERQPYVGGCAFAHKGGAHIDAVRKAPASFEHVPPESVGNERRVLLSDQSGGSTIVEKLQTVYPELDKKHPAVGRLLERVKHLEHEGYQFEAAEGSFRLLAEEIVERRDPAFTLERYRVLTELREGGEPHAEATIKVRVGDQVHHTAAEGVGPVDALAKALRKAITSFYPRLSSIRLTDYKVRVLDGAAGTATKVRVLIETTDGRTEWGTVGVSSDVIEASWRALADSIEYGLRIAQANGELEAPPPPSGEGRG